MVVVDDVQRTHVLAWQDPPGHEQSLARSCVEQVLGARDASMIDELFDPQAIGHGTPLVTLLPLWLAFPDLRLDVEDVTSDGDLVVVDSLATGTHVGSFLGIKSTGLRVEARRTDRFRMAHGRIVECWLDADLGALAAQLGTVATAAPRPAPSGPTCPGIARRATVQRFVERVLDGRRFVEGPGYVADRACDHPSASLAGCTLLAATPDFRLSVQDVHEEAATVTVVAEVSGTRRGRGGPWPVTGRFELRVRVARDGRFLETWADVFDAPVQMSS
ncbi:MAG: ester cyclase [Ilumatobacteraceae bacterium]